MTSPRSASVAALLALLLATGCDDVGAGVADLGDQSEAIAEHTRLCLSLARALSAVEEGDNTATAREAAEEVLAYAPEELQGPARTVAEHLRRAHEGEAGALRDPAFQTAVGDLRDGSKPVCDPTEPT